MSQVELGSSSPPADPGIAARPRTARGRLRPHGRALVAYDGLAVAGVVLAAMSAAPSRSSGLGRDVLVAAPACIGVVSGAATGAYADARRRLGGAAGAVGAVTVVAMAATLASLLSDSLAGFATSPAASVAMVPLLALALLAGRVALAGWEGRHPRRVLIVGSGRVARRLHDLSLRHPEHGSMIVGLVDDERTDDEQSGLPRLGGIVALEDVVRRLDVDHVVVAFSRRRDEETVRIVRQCHRLGVPVDVVPRLYELVGGRPRTHAIGGLPLIDVSDRPASPAQRAAKRAFDLTVGAVLAILAAPLVAIAAAAVALDDGFPVFYRQQRIGRDCRPFSIVKFRTMRRDAEVQTDQLLAAAGTIAAKVTAAKADASGGADARVTRVGRVLRRLSIDELPQIWNVLRGDMSLVGPRPLVGFEVDALDDFRDTRHAMRPGMTGLWQVLGRAEVGWQERVELDHAYVQHWSLVDDVRILARTVPAVLRRRGAV